MNMLIKLKPTSHSQEISFIKTVLLNRNDIFYIFKLNMLLDQFCALC